MPQILNKQLFLGTLQESYLFKDILSFERIRNSQAIKDLTKAVAYQIGSEVNENELLEKSYVIVKVYPYSKNPRREIGRNYKIYDKSLSKGANSFSRQYGAKVKLVNQQNYLEFLSI